jgi:hypothetical protein
MRDDRRALDPEKPTPSCVKDVQGRNVKHVLGLDILRVRSLTFHVDEIISLPGASPQKEMLSLRPFWVSE